MQSGYFVELNLKLKSIIICSVCSFFTISYMRVFHRLKRNIFMGNSIIQAKYIDFLSKIGEEAEIST